MYDKIAGQQILRYNLYFMLSIHSYYPIFNLARVFRSAPQFGVTLLTYELLQRFLYVDFGRG